MSLKDWTINDLPPSYFGVEEIVVSKKCMDEDYAELRLRGDYDADLPAALAVGESVVVKHKTHPAIRGTVDQPLRRATSSSQNRSVFVYGPWHYLAQTPYLFSYPYADGNVETTHVVFEGYASAVVADIISRAAAAGIIASSGNDYDFVNFTLPRSEAYDVTLADAFRTVMRYLPGGTLGFDYSVDPPRVVILGPTSSYLTIFSPSLTNCSNLDVKSREDLLLDGVRIDYEAAEIRKTRTWRHPMYVAVSDVTEETLNGYRHISYDSSGATSGRVMRKTISLSGSRTVTTLNWSATLHFGVPLADLFSISNWSTVHPFFLFNSSNFGSGYAYAPSGATLSMVLTAITGGFTVPTSGSASGWYWLVRYAANGSGSCYDNYSLRKFPDQILYSDDYTSGLKVLQADLALSFTEGGVDKTFLAKAFFAYGPTPGNISGSREIVEGEVEDPPSGIAAQILAKYADLQYDGSVSVDVEADPLSVLGYVGGPHRISFASPAITAPIQQRTVTVSTGRADLTFGTPQHLGPQDLLALYRAQRQK